MSAELLKISPENPDPAALRYAAEFIRRGEIVAIGEPRRLDEQPVALLLVVALGIVTSSCPTTSKAGFWASSVSRMSTSLS